MLLGGQSRCQSAVRAGCRDPFADPRILERRRREREGCNRSARLRAAVRPSRRIGSHGGADSRRRPPAWNTPAGGSGDRTPMTPGCSARSDGPASVGTAPRHGTCASNCAACPAGIRVIPASGGCGLRVPTAVIKAKCAPYLTRGIPERRPQLIVERSGRKPLVARFGGIPLRRQRDAVITDRLPVPGIIRHKELITDSWRIDARSAGTPTASRCTTSAGPLLLDVGVLVGDGSCQRCRERPDSGRTGKACSMIRSARRHRTSRPTKRTPHVP
jgi:hypothetical protein